MRRCIVMGMVMALMAGCSVLKSAWPFGRDSSEVIEAPSSRASSGPGAVDLLAGGSERESFYDGHELTGAPMVVEAVALTVNDQVITVSEILHPIRNQLRQAGRTGTVNEFVARVRPIIGEEIQRQIGEALLVERATQEFTDRHMAHVDEQLREYIDEMVLAAGSRAALEEQIQADGSTLADVRKALRRRLMSRLYVQLKMGSDGGVSRRDLWRYYCDHLEQFSVEAQVQMQILALPYNAFYDEGVAFPTEAQQQQARERAVREAAKALDRIRQGEDFAAVVADVAVSSAFRSRQGGVWPMMPAGSFREKAVEDAAFDMKEGQVSDVIAGDTAAFVVKTLQRREARVIPFEQAQEQIEQALAESRHRELALEYERQLRQRAVIVQADAFERFAMDRAVGLFYTGRG